MTSCPPPPAPHPTTTTRTTTSGPKSSLLHSLKADRSKHIRFLQDLLRAPSPNPPGDTWDAAMVIGEYLRGKGIPFEILEAPGNDTAAMISSGVTVATPPEATPSAPPRRPNLVSDFTGNLGPGPRLVYNGHVDVFPVGSSLPDWHRNPWSGDLEDVDGHARIYGRGVVDMKAGTAASVIAYAYLYANRRYLRGSVALVCVADEETGGKLGSAWLLDRDRARWGGDCMISGEPGGLGTVRFAEKGTLRMSFEVITKGGHGAYMHLSKGAIREAAPLLNELVDRIENMEVSLNPDLAKHLARPEVRAAADEAMGSGAADIMAKPTVNIGVIQGGLKVNMIPDRCIFEFDVRLPLGSLLASNITHLIETEILPRHPNASFTVQAAASNPASSCAFDHVMVGLLAKNAEVATKGKRKPVAIPSLGATDCKHYRYRGIPAYVYGISPEGMGAVDEFANVDEFLVVVETHAGAGWDYLCAGG